MRWGKLFVVGVFRSRSIVHRGSLPGLQGDPCNASWMGEAGVIRLFHTAGGADIALHVCAPVVASSSRAPGVHENRIDWTSIALGAQDATVERWRRHARQFLRLGVSTFLLDRPRFPLELSFSHIFGCTRGVIGT